MRDTRLKRAVAAAALFTAALWLIQVASVAGLLPREQLGIRPGSLPGLLGVITAPLVHGSFTHLLANTPPLLVLGPSMLYGFPRAAGLALAVIWLGSGFGVWLFAREAVHLGASGLAYGMLLFIFLAGMLRRDRRSMALAMIVFFLYGGMIWGVLPLHPGVSFESHLFGALAGVTAAVLLHHRDPLPARRVYDWEEEAGPAEQEQSYIMGELWRESGGPDRPGRPPGDE